MLQIFIKNKLQCGKLKTKYYKCGTLKQNIGMGQIKNNIQFFLKSSMEILLILAFMWYDAYIIHKWRFQKVSSTLYQNFDIQILNIFDCWGST